MNAVAPVVAHSVALPVAADESAFALAQRKALALSNSSLVPAQYRGRENMPNVLIALEIADRIGASPLQVMQNLYIVQGKPSWSSSFLIATVNACGRFHPLRFEVRGTEPAKEDYAVRAIAEDKATGEKCLGPWITWAMVKAEGWLSKNGSKWKTMPELMFMYRAAGFWSRVYAPEVSMGILTREEAEDVWGGVQLPNAPTEHGNIKALEAELTGDSNTPEAAADADSVSSWATAAQNVHDALLAAGDADRLDEVADLIRGLPEDQRSPLRALYERRHAELDGNAA